MLMEQLNLMTCSSKSVEAPTSGSFTQGDIVWNSNPQPGNFVGWVCVKAGNPGMWATFGEIR